MFKDPSHLEPKAFKSNHDHGSFRILLCWSYDYFVIIKLKVVLFLFQTSWYSSFYISEKENNIESYRV
jgi:hypothetical protein